MTTKHVKVRKTTLVEELATVQARLDIALMRIESLDKRDRELRVAFNQLIEAHNKHQHTIDWPQVMTLVIGPRMLPANIQM